MAYTSFFSNNSPTYKKAQPADNSGNSTGAGGKGGYKSYFGTAVKSAPTSQQLQADRDAKKKQQQTEQQQAAANKPAPPPKKPSILSSLGTATKSVGKAVVGSEQTAATGIARHLPGGTADIDAQNKQTEQTAKNLKVAKTITDPTARKKLINAQANDASQSQKTASKTLKELPSKKQLAAGFAGTAADIVSAGTLGTASKAGKTGKLLKGAEVTKAEETARAARAIQATTKTKKIVSAVKEAAPIAVTSGAAGGFNAAATGGNKEDVIKNFAMGAAAPGLLKGAGEFIAKGGGKVIDKVANSDKKLLNNKAVNTVIGSSKKGMQDLQNTKIQTTLNTLSDKESPKVIAAKVNPEHVNQYLHSGEIKQTPVHEITLGAETAGKKIDQQKVKQYEKQIKDGEPIEPVVIHKVNGQNVVVNGQNVVVDGQHRLAAAQKLGITDIPTVEKVPGAKPVPIEDIAATPKIAPEHPTIKAYGKEIELSPKNGYKATETPSGKVYSKVQRTGRNNKDSSLSVNHYDVNGNKLTAEQAKAVLSGELKIKPTPVAEAPSTPKASESSAVVPTTESKPIKEVASSSKESVAPELQAIRDAKPKTADTGTASRVYQRLKAEHPELKDDVSYDAIKLKEDSQKATDLIAKDKQQAYRVAMGAETSTEHTSTGVNIAMAEKALDEGNHSLYAQLTKNRSLAQTRRGQELVAEQGSVTDNSTSRYVKELLASRLDKVGKKYLSDGSLTLKKAGGATKDNAIKQLDKQVEKAQKQIRGKTLQLADAQAIIDRLSC